MTEMAQTPKFVQACYHIFYNLQMKGLAFSRPKPQKTQMSMSIQKPLQNILKRRKIQASQLQTSSATTKSENFNFAIGKVSPDETDKTKIWIYQIPQLLSQQKQCYLSFQLFDTTLAGFVGTQFPNNINLHFDELSGFMDDNGNPTTRALVLNLSQINTVMNPITNLPISSLIYKNQMPVSWPIGTTRTLTARVSIDDQPTFVEGPFENTFRIQFKIIHQSF